MLPFALAALLAVTSGGGDSAYATTGVRQLVERCATANARPPDDLQAYRARVETELAFLVRDTVGRERATQIEQVAASARWQRGGRYDLHVVGFRSQSIGVPFSALSFVHGWTVPLLYGNRLRLGIEGSSGGGIVVNRGHTRRDTIPIVHPFAPDRERYYRFSGGDTVAVLTTTGRAVPIVRIRVEPRFDDAHRVAGFRGEMDVDASSGAIVRMRGQVVYPEPTAGGGLRALAARAAGVVSAAYIEFVMAEVGGRYWLPRYERTEFQASASTFGPDRSVFRVLSRFRGYAVDTTPAVASDADSLPIAANVTYAATDSMNRFAGWTQQLGRATESVTSSDFADLAPDQWRATGPPRLSFFPRQLGQVLRYDRVEGAFTGAAAEMRFRDAAPGLKARVYGGWAWTERTMRGGASLTLAHDGWTYGVRAERQLASTNDFRRTLEGGASLGALLASIDNEDYVDRRIATTSVIRDVGEANRIIITGELGVGADRPEVARLAHGAFGSALFLPNRGVTAGRYARAAVDLEYHPNVSGEFVESGAGGRLHVEYGRGELNWLRTELSLAAREYEGDLWVAARATGGIVLGRAIPPQQLFEVGGNEGLPGYTYKQFGGDRAAVARLATGYTFPILRSPRRVIRRYMIPGISPGIAAGIQGGWAEAGTAAAWRSLALLGRRGPVPFATPVSVPTNGVRATADFRVTFFSGAASIGVARPVDHAAPWRAFFALGQTY